MNSLLRIYAIMHKEFLQLIRDKLTFAMIVVIPLVQLLMFGHAINTDVRHLSAAYADQANTHLSAQLIAEISASQVVDFKHRVDTAQQLKQLLDAGQISIGLYIPNDFDRRVIQRDRKAAQLMVDGTDPIIFGVARSLTSIPIQFDTQTQIKESNNLLEVQNFYNPERRDALNIVPGLIGVILTMTMVLFTAVAIVREKERGNMELLINTPIKTTELMLGKIVPYIVIGLLQLTIILFLGWLFFKVPIRGSLAEVYWIALIFIITNLSLGLLISTLANTQFQAMQMSFFLLLPSILLSGFMFPFDGMPFIAQSIAEALPLTHFNRLIRGVMLRGVDMFSMLDQVAALIAIWGITLTLAIKRFSKRLD